MPFADKDFCHHEVCKPPPNPNFKTTDGIVLLLKKMREREDWPKFIKHYGSLTRWDEDLAGTEKVDMIPIDHILTPGLLAEAAMEWFREGKGGKG